MAKMGLHVLRVAVALRVCCERPAQKFTGTVNLNEPQLGGLRG
jgi:hypothetical protein